MMGEGRGFEVNPVEDLLTLQLLKLYYNCKSHI